MEVILLERIEKLGNMGDTVKVKTGFARNYLLPEKKALRSTKENVAYFESKRKEFEERNIAMRSDAEKVAARIKGLEVVVVRQAAETGQLYGSVSIRDIWESMKDMGIRIERRQIMLDQPIKELGVYQVRVSPHSEVSETIKVNVARSQEDATRQLKTADAEAKAEAKAAAAAEAAAETAEAKAE